ncbi:outer membrane beta-barrel family protein [Prevotella sp. P4-51]|uniref:outer membrane beta-barrel family protein n=1 Tax=Prevotella sp. P4-51 TaxID=2024228 RepID=UPI0020B14A90|nr:outer membrane beta-barrel family protein [Prevotella sp. P4-51]
MKQTLISMALILMLALCAKAQNTQHSYTITGVVADSVTHEGESYATLTIARADSAAKPVKQALTDIKGRFSISSSGTGSYLLMVRSMGRKPMQRAYTVDATTRTIDLGTLLLQDGGNQLETVEVVAYKPLVKADVDKIAYSVEDDPEANTNTVIEMLKKVPMVTVDGQDNIRVNGNSSFKIYVNGKPNNMMTKNPKEVLKSMPASSIKKIEVITNPGPKYDAEGVGGILNIVTEGKGPEGYNATFSGRANNSSYGGGLYATVKQGKLTMSVNYNASSNHSPKGYTYSDRSQIGTDGTVTSSTVADGYTKGHSLWQGGDVEASYEIDTLRLITGSFSLSKFSSKRDALNTAFSTVPATGQRLYGYRSPSYSKENWDDYSASLDYQRSFSVKDRLLTLSYRLESSPSTSDSRYLYTDREAADDWQTFIDRMRDQRMDGDENTMEHTFQIDYTTPFAKHHTWEAGVKYILRRNKSDNDRYNLGTGDKDETYDSDNSSHYRHHNDILAAYTGYGLTLDKWSARLGLRYEHTLQKVEYLLGRGTNFHKNFDDLVPSARLGYKFSDATNLSLGYKMRINRPGIWYLNPYLDDRIPDAISQGNPNLDTEKSHAVDLQFSSYNSKLTYTLTGTYQFVNNSIESVDRLVNDRNIEGLPNPTGKDVIYSSYANIGHIQYAGLMAYANWTPITNTRITLNGSVGYSHMSDGQSLRNHGWCTNIDASLQQTFAKTWIFNASYYVQTPQPTLQGKDARYQWYNFSLSKSFMDKRLTLTAYIINPFGKRYFCYRSETVANNFRTTASSSWCQLYYGVSVRFRIGKLKASVKHTERTVENNDVKQGGGGGKG